MTTVDGEGGSRRRSGRRMHEPLQHIGIGGAGPPGDDPAATEPTKPASPDDSAPPAERTNGPAAEPPKQRRVRTIRIEERGSGAPRRTGLDRIRPRDAGTGRPAPGEAAGDLSQPAERDPLGRAALYSSGPKGPGPVLGTFLLECSACRRETPVTAGDLLRLGVPSIHLLFLKRYPSLMRCPACGRRTWLRIHWRI